MKDLAEELGVSETTVRRWKKRDHVHDRSSQPQELQTTLSPEEEAIVVEQRKTLLLSVDDLLCVVHEFINLDCSRSSLIRLLRRFDLTPLRDLMPEENERKYLFVAIDRATRWVYLETPPDKSAQSARAFLEHLIEASPIDISIILTDNGKEFTDRFCRTGERAPTGNPLFDQMCSAQNIDHHLIPPGHPQTNGLVERFNRRIEKTLNTTRFRTAKELEETLNQRCEAYNHHVRFRSINHRSPAETMLDYYDSHPKCFVSDLHNLPGFNSSEETRTNPIGIHTWGNRGVLSSRGSCSSSEVGVS